ncbi:MAG: hypothetical protein AAGE65_03795 [Planctomycetota bacterium]
MTRAALACLMVALAVPWSAAQVARLAPETSTPPADPSPDTPSQPGPQGEPEPAVAPVAPALEATPEPRPVDKLIAVLDAPDWPTRQRATEALMVLPDASPRVLADAINTHGLSIEAELRVRLALRHRLLAEMIARFPEPPDAQTDETQWRSLLADAQRRTPVEAGSLGINHAPSPADAMPERDGIEALVLDTLPGFPAYPTLRPGDALFRFDGRPIPPAPQPNQANRRAGQPLIAAPLNTLIQRYAPGDSVTLHVVRDGRERELRVSLGSLLALRAVYSRDTRPTVLTPPFQQALDRRLDTLLDD